MSNRTQYENDLAALKTALTEMGQSAADAVEAILAEGAAPAMNRFNRQGE